MLDDDDLVDLVAAAFRRRRPRSGVRDAHNSMLAAHRRLGPPVRTCGLTTSGAEGPTGADGLVFSVPKELESAGRFLNSIFLITSCSGSRCILTVPPDYHL